MYTESTYTLTTNAHTAHVLEAGHRDHALVQWDANTHQQLCTIADVLHGYQLVAACPFTSSAADAVAISAMTGTGMPAHACIFEFTDFGVHG